MIDGSKFKELRKGHGLSQRALADIAGVAQQLIGQIEAGTVRTTKSIFKLAAALRVSPHELDPELPDVVISRAPASTTPVVGFVGAGAQVNMYSEGQGPFDEVERPPQATSTTVAVQVRGDSMSGLADDGWIIYFDQRHEMPCEDLFGRLCVVGTADGRALVKKLMPGRKPGHFDLYSSNAAPMLDVEVIWCAKVSWIQPR